MQRPLLTTAQREKAVKEFGSATFPRCDAYETGCNCDLCREDDSFMLKPEPPDSISDWLDDEERELPGGDDW